MATIGTKTVKDCKAPMKAVDDGSGSFDFELVEGDQMLGQLIERGYFTAPGELHTDPDWGAYLQSYKSEPGSPSDLLNIARSANRFLQGFAAVEEGEAEVSRNSAGAIMIQTRVQTNGRSYLIPEVSLG